MSAQIDSVELKQVEILAPKKEVAPTQSVVELSGIELDKSRGLSLGETMQRMAGVQVLQTGPTIFKPIIQGMYGQRVLILSNGVRLEGQQWGSEHAPEIDPYLAGRLAVVKGASSVRYGSDAIGGVILVDPRPMRKLAGWGGELNIGAFSNNRSGVGSLILETASKKIPGLSARIQGSYRRAGDSKTPGYYLRNTAFQEYNFSYALAYAAKRRGVDVFYSQFNTQLGILSSAHIGNLTDLQRAIQSPLPLQVSDFSYSIGRPYQQVSHELFKVSAYAKTAGGSKLSLSYALQYNKRAEYDKDRPLNDSLAALNKPELDLRITTHTAQLLFEHRSVRNMSGTIGVSGIAQGNVFEGRFFIPNFKSYAGGIFLVEQWTKNKWMIEGGIRYDYKWMQAFFYRNNIYQNPSFVFSNISGSVGAVYQASNWLRWRANVGTGFRAPNVSELFSNGLHHGAAAVEIGDAGLKPEQAYNASVSANIVGKKILAEVSVYYTFIDRYIYLAPVFPATLTIRGAFPTFQYKQVDARFAGIDVAFSDSLSKRILIGTKISAVYAYNASADEYLVLTPPGRMENTMQYNFASGKKITTPYVGAVATSVFRKTNLPDSSDYAPAPAGYFLVGLQGGLSFRVAGRPMEIHIACTNLLNKSYRDYLDRFRYFADAVGRNVAVRLKWTI